MNEQSRTGFKARKPTNLSLDSELVDSARDLGINLSRACEEGLRKEVSVELGRRWKEENKEKMEAWNRWVEVHGMPLDKYRQF